MALLELLTWQVGWAFAEEDSIKNVESLSFWLKRCCTAHILSYWDGLIDFKLTGTTVFVLYNGMF